MRIILVLTILKLYILNFWVASFLALIKKKVFVLNLLNSNLKKFFHLFYNNIKSI